MGQRIALVINSRRPSPFPPRRRAKHAAVFAHRHVARVKLQKGLRLVGPVRLSAAQQRVTQPTGGDREQWDVGRR